MSQSVLVVAIAGWLLCILFGWMIGRPKGRQMEGVLLGLILGVVGVIITVMLAPEGPIDDGVDERYRMRDQRRRDRQFALMAGSAGVTALGVVLLVIVEALNLVPEPVVVAKPPRYELMIEHAIAGDYTTFHRASSSGFALVSCRYVHDGSDNDRKWGYECLFQREVRE